jgi:hypothetical protein
VRPHGEIDRELDELRERLEELHRVALRLPLCALRSEAKSLRERQANLYARRRAVLSTLEPMEDEVDVLRRLNRIGSGTRAGDRFTWSDFLQADRFGSGRKRRVPTQRADLSWDLRDKDLSYAAALREDHLGHGGWSAPVRAGR